MTNNAKKLILSLLIVIVSGITLSYVNHRISKKPLASDPVSDQIDLEIQENTVTFDSTASSTDSETLEQ